MRFYLRAVWLRLVAFGFRLLYNELAWLYDPVSWVVSLGSWRAWQRTIRPYLPAGGRVLEVGFGPGHLLVDLALDGYLPVGLDPSPAMLRLARRRLGRREVAVPICQGWARALPFAAQTFEAVVATFPTSYVYEAAWMDHVVRVLRPGGRLIVVEMASFRERTALDRSLEWLYGITGQRGPAPGLPRLLRQAGLTARAETVEVDGTTVGLVLAEKDSVQGTERIREP